MATNRIFQYHFTNVQASSRRTVKVALISTITEIPPGSIVNSMILFVTMDSNGVPMFYKVKVFTELLYRCRCQVRHAFDS